MTNYNKQNSFSIQEMFASISKDYDKTNAILSFNLHRVWNRKLIKLTSSQVTSQQPILLDLCAGTGEIAHLWLKQFQTPQKAYLLDFCNEMLDIAKTKMKMLSHDLHFIQASAEEIPLEDSSIDAITAAYGIRNINSMEKCFHETLRVLKPGGTFSILELTAPKHPLIKPFHAFYLKHILPKVGGMVAKNKEAYKYLCQSIQNFIEPNEIKNKLYQLGYQKVNIYSLNFGISTILVAKK